MKKPIDLTVWKKSGVPRLIVVDGYGILQKDNTFAPADGTGVPFCGRTKAEARWLKDYFGGKIVKIRTTYRIDQ